MPEIFYAFTDFSLLLLCFFGNHVIGTKYPPARPMSTTAMFTNWISFLYSDLDVFAFISFFLSYSTRRMSESPFQIGPILLVNEPFTVRFWNLNLYLLCSFLIIKLTSLVYPFVHWQIDNGLMTPTMKIRRDRVVAKYKEQIDNLYKWTP